MIYRALHFCLLDLNILKACGAVLIVPHVASGFQWNGERVRLLSHQSSLYIRSLYPLLKVVYA